MGNVSVSMTGLGKRYDDGGADESSWAVRSVDLKIFAGEVTVLMGPSGSGKTTLLTMVGCLLKPSCGQISVLGQAMHESDETARQVFRRHQIGFIFQNYNLLTALTAEQNVRLALGLRNGDESTATQLLDDVGMAEKAHSYPQNLSGGQRQRVAIARALAGNPPLLLADEPTAALDATQGRRVMQLLKSRAQKHGTTVIVVTHDPRVIGFADRIVELEDGSVRRIYRPLPIAPTAARNVSVQTASV